MPCGKYLRTEEYRRNMSKIKKLSLKEIIHHINGDKTDNHLENLKLFSDKAHLSFHHKMGVKV